MHTSLMLKEMNVGVCGVAQAHSAGEETCICVIFPHMYTPKKGKNMIFFAFHQHFLPYGQLPSWCGVTVKCVPPPPAAHSYSTSHHHLKK